MLKQWRKSGHVSSVAFAVVCYPVTAATRDKANNQNNLNLGSSWLSPDRTRILTRVHPLHRRACDAEFGWLMGRVVYV